MRKGLETEGIVAEEGSRLAYSVERIADSKNLYAKRYTLNAKNVSRLAPRILRLLFLPFILWSWCQGISIAEDGYIQVPGVIDVESNISGGLYSVDTLARMAKENGLKVVIFGDTLLARWEYGLPPFRNLIKRTFQRQSVFKYGVRNFLNRIKEAGTNFPDMIFIPGVEVAADYYWSGVPFKKDFSMHNWHRHILVIGLENESDYRQLPVKYDPYRGDRGVAPYQEIIDYCNKKGAPTFWAHPEAELSRAVNGIQIETKPYQGLLKDAQGYTGFASLYQDRMTVIEPGNLWDKLLLEYCKGERNTPVWGIGELDFEGGSKAKGIDAVQTIFLIRKMTREDVLDALKKGRYFALLKGARGEIILDEFSASGNGGKVTMSEELNLGAAKTVRLRLKVSAAPFSADGGIKVRIIKNGGIMKALALAPPIEVEMEDIDLEDGMSYYRIDIQSAGAGRIITNPIFVRRAPQYPPQYPLE